MDIQELITNSVAENKTLEYKQELKIATVPPSDGEKKEFLADVSAFANTEGGDIIYGISEKDSIPKDIIGIEIIKTDELLRKIDNLIRDGLQPRITHQIKILPISGNKYILLLHIEKSWNRPHRVILGGSTAFYARNSKGKYLLDTFELRDMFNLSNTLITKINSFKNERIFSILDGNAPVPISQKGNVILHFIPFDSLNPMQETDIKKLKEKSVNLGLLYLGGWNTKYNLNGCLLYSPASRDETISYDYTQIFRNGSIEAVDGLLFSAQEVSSYFPEKNFPIYTFEETVLHYFTKVIDYFKSINIQPPVYFSISLINVLGYSIPENNTLYSSVWGKSVIDTDVVKLPESIINDFDIKPESVLRPMYDIIYNACGQEKSNNFDDQGNFKLHL
ncbi:MAG: ATP-binding protein [Tannerella sp.]|nr:ATP-binding protein [Tannerella sp.]